MLRKYKNTLFSTQCGKLISAINMRRHIRYVHSELHSTTPYECKICNTKYQHKLYLDNHVKTITHRKLAADKKNVQDTTENPATATAASQKLAGDSVELE